MNLKNNLVGDEEVAGQANIHAQVNKLTNEIVAKVLKVNKEVKMSASKIMNKMDEQHQEVMSELIQSKENNSKLTALTIKLCDKIASLENKIDMYSKDITALNQRFSDQLGVYQEHLKTHESDDHHFE